MKYYSNKCIDDYIQWRIGCDSTTTVYTIEEGCLMGYGLAVVVSEKFKTLVIKEQYLNQWSSAYKIRFYNETPKKYLKMIENM